MNRTSGKLLLALGIVLGLFGFAVVAVEFGGWVTIFGVVLPYLALLLFLGGMLYRIIDWARSPVPFRIPTTGGQQKSLPWIKQARLDNPSSSLGVLGRMVLEVFFFRSLFRNVNSQLAGKGAKRLVFGPKKWLWLAGLVFHWSFLIILLRHFRFFAEPVPWLTEIVISLDGFMEVGLPVFYATTVFFLVALLFLLGRRLYSPQLRYLTLVNDYFPLVLLIGIGTSGLLLRHFMKTDVSAVKELTMGLVTFSPAVSSDLNSIFFGHLFLVSVLLAYLPFSKLTHMAGVFMSPTRNLANNNRAKRHVNPWDHPVDTHSYEEWEDDFRDKMIAVGIPVERQSDE